MQRVKKKTKERIIENSDVHLHHFIRWFIIAQRVGALLYSDDCLLNLVLLGTDSQRNQIYAKNTPNTTFHDQTKKRNLSEIKLDKPKKNFFFNLKREIYNV